MRVIKTPVTRRDFLRGGSTAALAGLISPSVAESAAKKTASKSRVVLVRHADAVTEDGALNSAVLREMLEQAVTALYEAKDHSAAWRHVVKSDDVVGIKTNVWHSLPTPEALNQAIRDEVVAAGVRMDSVSIDDRGVRGNPVFQRATAIINIRPMRTHHWSGLGTCLKNMIMFVPRPPDYHGDSCATLGAIWKLPELEGKVRLNVLVMLTPLYHSVGPHGFTKEFVWPYRGLIVGMDPVAVDATGARIIEAKRKVRFGDDRLISPPPHHIAIADTRYGLGHAALEAIDLVRLGWGEDALI